MPTVRKVRRKKAPPKRRKKVVSSKSTLEASLPETPNEPPKNLLEYCVMLFGRKGVGKTALSAEFPDSLTFMFEVGRRNLPIIQIPQRGEPKLTWPAFLEYIDLFIDSEFKTAVVDTIDRCYQACFDYVCRNRGVKHPQMLGSESYGLWDEIASTFEEGLFKLLVSDKGVVFISHDKVRKTELHTGEVLEMIEPSCKPAAYRFLQTVADFVFYYTYRKGERVLYLNDPSGYVWCSVGAPGTFRNPDDTAINILPVSSESPSKAFSDLMAGYENKSKDMDFAPQEKKRKLPSRKKSGDK